VETPQQNSIVERKHQHILNVTRSLLFQSNFPVVFWSYVVTYATNLINKIPTDVLEMQTPYDLLYKEQPNLQNLMVFGYLCFASSLQRNTSKLDPRARKCIFLRYKTGMKGYVVFDVHNKEIFVSRNVNFYEYVFPYTENNNCNKENGNQQIDAFDFNFEPVDTNESYHIDQTEENTTDENSLRRSYRHRRSPSYLKDYHCQLSSHIDTKRLNHSSKVLHSLSTYLDYGNLTTKNLNYVLAISSNEEPHNYNEAIQKHEWCEAMKKEIKALEENETWIITDLPHGKQPTGCKWMYKIKYNAKGDIERYNARLVAKGYTQLEGIDYLETYNYKNAPCHCCHRELAP